MNRCLVFLFLSINAIAFGQERISFGVKGGVNFATFGGRDFLVDNESRTGFHIGLVVQVPIRNKFSIQPELLYSQQGSKSESDITLISNPSIPETTVSSKIVSKYDYINIPIIAQYEIAPKFNLGIGPQFGFNINAEAEETSSNEGIFPASTTDFSDLTETFDLGLVLNAEFNLPLGLFFQARYVLGLTNIDSSEVMEGGFNEDPLLNKVFQLSVGYKF